MTLCTNIIYIYIYEEKEESSIQDLSQIIFLHKTVPISIIHHKEMQTINSSKLTLSISFSSGSIKGSAHATFICKFFPKTPLF